MKKGLTLIELIAVLIVIGIITVIVIPIVLNSINIAKKRAFESDTISVLHRVEYEKLVDKNFDPTTVDINNFTERLSIPNDNFYEVSMNLYNNQVYITIIGENKWSGLKACGTSDSIKIVPINDEITCLSFYGPWSAWQDIPVSETETTEVETATFYNYQTAEYDWGDWYDLDPTYVNKSDSIIIPIYNVGDKEQRNLYRYRDTSWRWYVGQNRCRQDVWNACWTGYTNSASRCNTTCQSYHGASCGGSYAGQWGPHLNSSGYACYCGYRSYISGTNYYAGGAWVTGACPGGYYSYESRNAYYPGDTTQANGTYHSTAPSGYPTKDTSSSVVSDWTYTDTTTPANQSYREVQIKRQEREWIQRWSVEVLETYKNQAEFATEIQNTLGITVEELQNRRDVNIITKIMYRYRTKNQ